MTTPSGLSAEQRHILSCDLNPRRVSQRSQSGSKLSYVEAWDVKATLIRVFGFAGFSAEVIASKIERIWTKDEYGQGKANWVVLATATVRLTIHQTGAVYTESAASSQSGSAVGDVADFALKTAESDALKRAAIYLGTQFGLSLYNAGATRDVVQKVYAPGQEWPIREPQAEPTHEEPVQTDVQPGATEPVPATVEQPGQPTAQQEVQNLQAIADGGPAVLPAGNGLTPEQRAENEALLQRGLRMKAEQQAAAAPAAE